MKILQKDPRLVQIRTFRCTVCGGTSAATKRKHPTGPGHVKTMWCVWCRSNTEHVQLGEFGLEEEIEAAPQSQPFAVRNCP